MTSRRIICACEDISYKDVEAVIDQGHADIESIKRYTGLGTGVCQGRQCVVQVAEMLAHRGVDIDTIHPITARPPLVPTRFADLAVEGALAEIFPSDRKVSPPTPTWNATLDPLPESAEVVIVGGGIMGLATAYHLARNGVHNVVVLERSYINAGASGRNGGGIRQQWSTEMNVTLMQQSMRYCREFAQELGVNTWLRQGGYLFITREQQHLDRMAQQVAMHNRLGVPTKILTARQTDNIVRHMKTDDLVGACYNPTDGVLFPWPFLWGYAEGAKKNGAQLFTFTEVTGLEIRNKEVVAVETTRGRINCDLVINAAAAWAPDIAKMAGVHVPNKPERHEILVTESFKPFLDPLVSEIGTGLYFSQSLRGEIVGGMGDPDEPAGVETRSSLRFITRMARAMVHRMPHFADVKVIRQWAGCYDVTPDHQPIIGEVEEVAGFFQLHGFVGHGFMMAPVVCKIVGEYLAKGIHHPLLDMSKLKRFSDGSKLQHETMIIG